MKNPFLSALAAVAYVALVALFMSLVPQFIPEPENPLPIILSFLSLFVLSAAVMGYLILGTPLQLFLEGKKKEAVTFFFKTVVAFGACATLVSIVVFSLTSL